MKKNIMKISVCLVILFRNHSLYLKKLIDSKRWSPLLRLSFGILHFAKIETKYDQLFLKK